jgi:hypothetical protein
MHSLEGEMHGSFYISRVHTYRYRYMILISSSRYIDLIFFIISLDSILCYHHFTCSNMILLLLLWISGSSTRSPQQGHGLSPGLVGAHGIKGKRRIVVKVLCRIGKAVLGSRQL